jgi:head-tail adaptor
MQRKKKETIGTLDSEICIQRKTITENEYTEKVETWTELLTVWASVTYPLTGAGESYDEGINVYTRSIIFEIRATDILVSDRIKFDSMFFDINGIEKERITGRYKIHCSSSR